MELSPPVSYWCQLHVCSKLLHSFWRSDQLEKQKQSFLSFPVCVWEPRLALPLCYRSLKKVVLFPYCSPYLLQCSISFQFIFCNFLTKSWRYYRLQTTKSPAENQFCIPTVVQMWRFKKMRLIYNFWDTKRKRRKMYSFTYFLSYPLYYSLWIEKEYLGSYTTLGSGIFLIWKLKSSCNSRKQKQGSN